MNIGSMRWQYWICVLHNNYVQLDILKIIYLPMPWIYCARKNMIIFWAITTKDINCLISLLPFLVQKRATKLSKLAIFSDILYRKLSVQFYSLDTLRHYPLPSKNQRTIYNMRYHDELGLKSWRKEYYSSY